MADLSILHRWERFAPDIGNNRQLPEADRLWLEVKSSMTRAELIAFNQRLADLHRERGALVEKQLKALERNDGTAAAQADFEANLEALVVAGYTAALSEVARVVGRNTLGGAPCNTLEEYLAAVHQLADGFNVLELVAAVKDANSVGGSTQLFSGRRSGGWAGTRAQSAAED